MTSSVEQISIEKLSAQSKTIFQDRFGYEPEGCAYAPGRVNLIGEHVDYNDGFVLPFGIDRHMAIVCGRSESRTSLSPLLNAYSVQHDQMYTFYSPSDDAPKKGTWQAYVYGVWSEFDRHHPINIPVDAVINSTVPIGAGLSSSAALEVGLAISFQALTDSTISKRDLALSCQKAEHQYAGVPCGIMDQFASALCDENHLLLIDCKSLESTLIPFDDPDAALLIIDTGVKHKLADDEYGKRREQCDTALRVLGLTSWRDASHEGIRNTESELTEVLTARARHVVSEIERTERAVDAVRKNDWSTVGELMYASHDSLRDDFQVSCNELDQLVDIARSMGTDAGVYGSRMTGGGFGGCTVSLVKGDRASELGDSITAAYHDATGHAAKWFVTRPVSSAHWVAFAAEKNK